MPKKLDEIVLQRAYSFVCSNCSHRQFGEMVEAELTPDERAEVNAKCGIENWDSEAIQEGVDLVMAPNHVTCDACGTVFKVWIDSEDIYNPDSAPENDFE